MKKPVVITALLIIPALLILSGFYFEQELLSSIGYVVLIFYVIMAIRGKFNNENKN
jgi:hypothetical protein